MNQMAIRVIVGVALLVVAVLTFTSIRESDQWRHPGKTTSRANDPYDGLARTLATTSEGPSAGVRDPFRPASTGAAPIKAPTKVAPPPAPARELPVLTAILVSEDGNQAVFRYLGKNFTVGAGALFADYQVVSVTADAVVLRGPGGETLTLHSPKKGD